MNKRHLIHVCAEIAQVSSVIVAAMPVTGVTTAPIMSALAQPLIDHPDIRVAAFVLAVVSTVVKQVFGNTPQNHRKDHHG